jgi:hypothetical protein
MAFVCYLCAKDILVLLPGKTIKRSSMLYMRTTQSHVLPGSIRRNSSIASVPQGPTKYQNLQPNFVTGFSDGECCFKIIFCKSKTVKTGWSVRCEFSIELSNKDKALLEQI